MELLELKEKNEAPSWLTEAGYQTLRNGYLLPEETPKDMWMRICKSSAGYLNKPDKANEFFQLFWNNWLCPATPIASNAGTDRGLVISCFGVYTDDSVDGIFKSFHEIAMLTKNGGGIGNYYGDVRGRNAKIKGNGVSEGIIPWLKILDSVMVGVSQGYVRRGSASVYIRDDHSDLDEFLDMRKPTGDVNRRCLNLHHGIGLSDDFMNSLDEGNVKNRETWAKILDLRFQTGEPYIQYTDNINNQNPECYKANGLKVNHTQLCTEIMLHNSSEETYTCCLSSMNLVTYDEWKDTNAVELAIEFLDGIVSEFISKAKNVPGLEKAVLSAERGRPLGLGVLGWHSFLQKKLIPFESFQAKNLNTLIFKNLREKAEKATKLLAEEYGEPFYCKGFNRRNTHLLAVAPTVSNSTISGGWSAGVEAISANIYSLKSAKGTFVTKNVFLQDILKSYDKDTHDVWSQINSDQGSVINLDFLTENEKKVFATAREINQHVVVTQAADRQRYIDQGQSINLFFSKEADPKYIHEVHYNAWKQGLKSLYYLRAESVLRSDSVYRSSDCIYCEA